MSKYKYKYDENVELSIYHPIVQSCCLILWAYFVNLLKNFNLLNIKSFVIRI